MGEALAMGLPVLVSRAAPFLDLISTGIAIPVDTNAELQIALDGIRDGRFNVVADREKRTAYFNSELSIAANTQRLHAAWELAAASFPSTFPARLAVLQKLANVLQGHFGVDILNADDDGNARSRAERSLDIGICVRNCDTRLMVRTPMEDERARADFWQFGSG